MAKRQKATRFSIQSLDNKHYRTTEQYALAVDALFDAATKAISKAAAKGKFDPDKPFSFDDYPSVKAVMQDVSKQLASRLTTVIETGSRKQWLFACEKNDGFIDSIIDTSMLSRARLKKMQDRNLDALSAFQGRKVDGMNLSQRVWRYVRQYREQMESALDVGLGEGRDAQQLARDVKQNLKDPNRLFRRVRDKRGNLVLSKAAKAFHPGRGVYRSSVKNAQRLTRSEINMAYRESDWQRWQSLDFVVGFEIVRSNHEPLCKCEVCEKLKGRYPKTFKFKGWHPQCMCYAIPILMNEETFDDNELGDLKAALRGTTYKHKVANTVVDVPDGFKEWVQDHIKAQERWATTPYFIKDNFKNGNLADGLKIALPTIPATPKIDPVQQQLNALQPQIASIRQMCSEWGLNTYPLDTALAARSPKEVVFAISTLKDRVNDAMNELKLFVTDAAKTIKEARTNKVDSNDVFADLQAVNADKSDWLMGKATMKQRLEDLKAKIKALLSPAHPAILSKYDTDAQVDTTFKKINSEFTTEKWFEHGDLALTPTRKSGVNGFTYMDGRISLTPDRLERVKSALSKIGSGKPKDITFEEADAMATFWREITHNRNIPGNMRTTSTQTDVMEMMNEFVARKTLPEFYAKLGCKDVPHPEFITNRASTGYNRRVLGYDFVIQKLGLDAKKVLDSAKKNLFTLKYSEQDTTATQALIDGGLDTFKGANGKKIGKAQLNKIVAMCRKGYSTVTIENYLKDQGII
ncbi:hypothetical protein [Bacteroides pyogenes]|uniref:hypothetical protein n=1 Tax=Bacteroides pyogenes TaxID=310300 RepID=UPI002FD8C136